MSINVKAIVASQIPTSDLYAERSLIAACLLDVRAIDALPELEVDDFANLEHRQLLGAIRSVQALGVDVTAESVLDEIARSDRERDTHGLGRLAPCVVETMHARIAMDTSPDELRWLFRRVRDVRRARERFAA